MQTMQDKDLDQLFHDAFADAEIVPTKDLWGTIEQEIKPKKSKGLPLYWMAAAMVLIAVSTGLLLNKQDKIQLHGKTDITKYDVKPRVSVKNESYQQPIIQETKRLVLNNEEKNTKAARLINNKPIIKSIVTKYPEPLMAQTGEKTEFIKKDVVVSIEKFHENAEMVLTGLQNQTIADNAINENDQADHKTGIKNIGDLVNYVVGRVDKREDKLISFKNNEDDDGFTLASINIGSIKFNLHKRK